MNDVYRLTGTLSFQYFIIVNFIFPFRLVFASFEI